MSTKLLTAPRSVAPGSLGHRWDSHMRAASIKLVQAGQASVCCTTLSAVKWLRWTDTQATGQRLPPAALWWYKQRKGHAGMLDGGIWRRRCQVSEIVITKADNTSVLPLCEIVWMRFRRSVWRKRLNKSYNFMSHMSLWVVHWCRRLTSDPGLFCVCATSELCP